MSNSPTQYLSTLTWSTCVACRHLSLTGYAWLQKYCIPWKFWGRKVSRFLWFLHGPRNLLYESSRWHCSNMDLRESILDSAKVFSQKSACTTCRKTFLPRNFHGIQMPTHFQVTIIIWSKLLIIKNLKDHAPLQKLGKVF